MIVIKKNKLLRFMSLSKWKEIAEKTKTGKMKKN